MYVCTGILELYLQMLVLWILMHVDRINLLTNSINLVISLLILKSRYWKNQNTKYSTTYTYVPTYWYYLRKSKTGTGKSICLLLILINVHLSHHPPRQKDARNVQFRN